MHADANTLPTLDAEQNILYVRGRENGTHTRMIFRRYLDTCDELHDTKITVYMKKTLTYSTIAGMN